MSAWRWYLRRGKWAKIGIAGGLAFVVLVIISAAAGGGSDDEPAAASPDTASSPAASASANATAETATATPTSPKATNTPTNTPPPTATRTPTNTATPTRTPPPPGFSFGNGTSEVGTTVIAGATYRTRTGSSGCYWARLSGFGGTVAEILANENTNGPDVVTIGLNDKGFESRRCATWTQDLSPITKGLDEPFGEGTFIVGVDINPGTWKSDGTGSCYWERLSAFGGSGIQGIIANDNTDGATIVTIGPSDKGFKSARCGTWRRQ